MNKEKQKIISDICPFYKEYGSCDQCNTVFDIEDPPCYWECIANVIINNNYHKQIEGEWVRQEKILGKVIPEAVCSICGRDVTYQVIDNKWEFENYCSHCGAKMKGGAE